LLAVGVTALVLSGSSRPALIVLGAATTAVGVLFVGPLAIRALAGVRRGMPVAIRLALTDLVRYQTRAGAALAAISLASGISVAIVAGSAAAEYTTKQSAGLGNLSTSQLLIRIGAPDSTIPERTAAQLAQLQAPLNAIIATLGTPVATPLEMAVSASISVVDDRGGGSGHPAVEVGVASGDANTFGSYPLYVATPQVLGLYGLDPGAIPATTDVLSVRSEGFELVNTADRGLHPTIRKLPNLGYTSVPNNLVTPSAVARHGWQAVPVGWLLQANHPLSADELSRAQELAGGAGLTIEARREQTSLTSLRTGATVAGVLLALGVLATTVGLIRGEGANDLRTLTATGAPRRVRRTLTATTAGALAMLGAALGLVGAYVGLVAVLHHNLDALRGVPVVHLAVIAVGLPLLASVAGWLLAGRQPRSFARRGLD
jgi:putative ABC transport system permease protein